MRFEYLWRSEENDGHSAGEKHRPCAVVIAINGGDGLPARVMLCAITHTEPRPPSIGVPISPEARKAAGLDDQDGWVIASEVNKAKWSDRRFARTPSGTWIYGCMPEDVMDEVRNAIAGRVRTNELDIVNREDIDQRIARDRGA